MRTAKLCKDELKVFLLLYKQRDRIDYIVLRTFSWRSVTEYVHTCTRFLPALLQLSFLYSFAMRDLSFFVLLFSAKL